MKLPENRVLVKSSNYYKKCNLKNIARNYANPSILFLPGQIILIDFF